MLDDLQMAGFVGKTATNARSAAASRVLVAGGGGDGKRSRVHFRQRHGGGRCVPAPFQPSLRLPFTFPLAEPLTEANVKYSGLEKV